MYVTMWEFFPKPARQSDFETMYSSTGEWVRLFSRSPGFIDTELLWDVSRPNRYLVIDRWQSREAFDAFKRAFEVEYGELDAKGEELTLSETPVGSFETVA